MDDLGDAWRRTRLATERTELAWWRTGLASLAVAIGIGQIVPSVNGDAVEWPYVVLGVAFAVYGIALIWFGRLRARAMERAVESGDYAPPSPALSLALGVYGMLLGVGVAVVIVVT